MRSPDWRRSRSFQRLQTLPGVGPILAMTIVAEARDLRRFGHVRQFLKYCGFDLCTEQSGQFRGTTHLSKRGNARLRYAFWMAGMPCSEHVRFIQSRA